MVADAMSIESAHRATARLEHAAVRRRARCAGRDVAPTGGILRVNRGGVRARRAAREDELLAPSFWDLVHPADHGAVARAARGAAPRRPRTRPRSAAGSCAPDGELAVGRVRRARSTPSAGLDLLGRPRHHRPRGPRARAPRDAVRPRADRHGASWRPDGAPAPRQPAARGDARPHRGRAARAHDLRARRRRGLARDARARARRALALRVPVRDAPAPRRRPAADRPLQRDARHERAPGAGPLRLPDPRHHRARSRRRSASSSTRPSSPRPSRSRGSGAGSGRSRPTA